MDPWLEDDVKGLLARPCLSIAGRVGERMDDRIRRGASNIDERALTEDFVDCFDTSSRFNAWGQVLDQLRDRNIFMHTSVRKSTVEYQTGADIGLVLRRDFYDSRSPSRAHYAALIQCKRVDEGGRVSDFYHTVSSTGRTQSSLLLDITPASFYFIFAPPCLIKVYTNFEPIGFVRSTPGCSSPVWNMGCFAYPDLPIAPLSVEQKAQATGVMVVPAMGVEAQQLSGKTANLDQLLSNALPFWYWFAELFVPGFVGDYRQPIIEIAQNKKGAVSNLAEGFGVRHTVEIGMGNG
jgi:hypothetical protein